MTLFDIRVDALDGTPLDMTTFADKVLLVVNVASQCGFTPQYSGLERIHRQTAGRGFSVLGAPCNQFGEQEPGTPAEIAAFCATTYQVTFPLTAKLAVNGPGRHELFSPLVVASDDDGEAGDVRWNFEKFLVARDGTVLRRFRSAVEPESPALAAAIEAALGA